MKFDIKMLYSNYNISREVTNREVKKWAFSLVTFGFGALYLWFTTKIIKQGELGIRRDFRGEVTLLPPGRHSNFPWESYPVEPQKLSNNVVSLTPYTVLTVKTGFVAKTFNKGVLEILPPGQHVLTEATHVFSGFVLTKQETQKLPKVNAYTNDNVGFTIDADVRYQIIDPTLAITQINGIENSITEIAKISISQIVGSHKLADFIPSMDFVGGETKKQGVSEVINELTKSLSEQLLKLGIQLLNIGITSWSIDDKNLASQLAHGAVVQSEAQSKMLAADREAKIRVLAAEAEATAKIAIAKGEAQAMVEKGEAVQKIVETFKDNPTAVDVYKAYLNASLIQGSSKATLFFNVPSPPQVTIPVSAATPTNP